jgi:hypothetical protein
MGVRIDRNKAGMWATLGAVVLLCVSAAACAPMQVSSHVDRERDFSQYRTYDWGPADTLPAGDPRLERNAFFQDHIQGAIERNMAARGFERAAPGTVPDVRLHFHAVIDRRLDVNQLDSRAGYRVGGDSQAGLADYEEGTLVVDVIDVQSNRLVWRGWARNSLEGVLENKDRLARQIEDAVRLMFQRLPAAR